MRRIFWKGDKNMKNINLQNIIIIINVSLTSQENDFLNSLLDAVQLNDYCGKPLKTKNNEIIVLPLKKIKLENKQKVVAIIRNWFLKKPISKGKIQIN